jgi:hypothetical protein
MGQTGDFDRVAHGTSSKDLKVYFIQEEKKVSSLWGSSGSKSVV